MHLENKYTGIYKDIGDFVNPNAKPRTIRFGRKIIVGNLPTVALTFASYRKYFDDKIDYGLRALESIGAAFQTIYLCSDPKERWSYNIIITGKINNAVSPTNKDDILCYINIYDEFVNPTQVFINNADNKEIHTIGVEEVITLYDEVYKKKFILDHIVNGTYTINRDGSVDVRGDVLIADSFAYKPKGFYAAGATFWTKNGVPYKFNKVDGAFVCTCENFDFALFPEEAIDVEIYVSEKNLNFERLATKKAANFLIQGGDERERRQDNWERRRWPINSDSKPVLIKDLSWLPRHLERLELKHLNILSLQGMPDTVYSLDLLVIEQLPNFVGVSSNLNWLSINTSDIKSLEGLPPNTFTGLEIRDCDGLVDFTGAPTNVLNLDVHECRGLTSFKGLQTVSQDFIITDTFKITDFSDFPVVKGDLQMLGISYATFEDLRNGDLAHKVYGNISIRLHDPDTKKKTNVFDKGLLSKRIGDLYKTTGQDLGVDLDI
jgi:hypothetical protein